MKKYKYIVLAIIFFIIIGLSMTLAGPYLQGMFMRFTQMSSIKTTTPKIPIKNYATPIANTKCNVKKINAAFIILYQDDSQITPQAQSKFASIKDEFTNAFQLATRNLATISIDPEVYTLKVDKSLFIGDSTNIEDEFTTYGTIVKQFLNIHGDNYDQLFFGFTWGDKSVTQHVIIKNDILGIGMDTYEDHSINYGTQKLQGYTLTTNLNTLVYPADGLYANSLLHELGHQWCCYAGDNFTGDNTPGKMEIKQDYIHFYQGLASPYETQTAMNAKKWVPNGDGTFHADETLANTPTLRKYHPIMLYYMGLLPKAEYDTKYNIYNMGPDDPANMYESFNYDSATLYQSVSVNDIIGIIGERKCK